MQWRAPAILALVILVGCGDQDSDSDPCHSQNWYADRDADGFGDFDVRRSGCVAPAGYVENSADCDDAEPLANPENDEVCDFIDNDCNGQVDDGVEPVMVYPDGDGDGYGPEGAEGELLCDPGERATAEGDCDDDDPARSPGSKELVCDGVDQDCDGLDNDVVLDERGADSLAAAAAEALDGSLIELCDGTYLADLEFDGVSVGLLGSAANPEAVVLDGGVSMQGGTLTVEGLTLTGLSAAQEGLLDVLNGGLVLGDVRFDSVSQRPVRFATETTDNTRRALILDGVVFSDTEGALWVEHLGQVTMTASLNEVVADGIQHDDGAVVLRSDYQLEVEVTGSSFDFGGAAGLNGVWTLDTSYRIELGFTDSSINGAVLASGAAISVVGSKEVVLDLTRTSVSSAYSSGYASAIGKTGAGWVVLSTDQAVIESNTCDSAFGAAAVRLGSNGAVTSVDTHWGTDQDNTPADLSSSGSVTDALGESETFTCTPGAGCSFD